MQRIKTVGNSPKIILSIQNYIRDNAVLIGAIVFNLILFLPIMGRGFFIDDFDHLASVNWGTLSQGLFKINGGPFYTPIAWLSYKIDWELWGGNPFAFATTNLTLHLLSIVLIYNFVLRLKGSRVSAGWAAWGYALLYPALAWTIMWVASRAHVLAAFFCLATMYTFLLCIQARKYKFIYAVLTLIFASGAIFSKESGISVIPIIIALLLYQSRLSFSQDNRRYIGIIVVILFLVIAPCYFLLRSNSGAVNVKWSCVGHYKYCFSWLMILENLSRYFFRTFGLLALVAMAGALSIITQRKRPIFNTIDYKDVLFSLTIFLVAIAPVVMIRLRSGIYTYLPGIGAALLLGFISRSPFSNKENNRLSIFSKLPLAIIIIVFGYFTLVHSHKFMKLAEVDAKIIKQIKHHEPIIAPNSLIILRYSEYDRTNRFPEGENGWWFPSAVRLLYLDQTLNGKIIQEKTTPKECFQAGVKCFKYVVDSSGKPIIKSELSRENRINF